jgi:hypothetical protein
MDGLGERPSGRDTKKPGIAAGLLILKAAFA